VSLLDHHPNLWLKEQIQRVGHSSTCFEMYLLSLSGAEVTEVQEETILTDNTEETYADNEGGDSLIDYGEAVGNKEPGETMAQ
jgi:hypothetical protein